MKQLNIRSTMSVFFFTYLWITPFVWKETFNKSSVTQNRLQQLPPQLDAEVLYNRFSSFWQEELSKRRPKLWFALLRTFLLELSLALVTGVSYLISSFSLVYALIWIINGLENTDLYSTVQLFGISTLLPLCGVAAGFCGHTMEYMLNIIGMKYRVLLTTAIYKKILQVSYARINSVSSGTIITMITSDLFKFDALFNYLVFLFISPLGIILVVIFGYIETGLSALLIIPVFILQVAIQIGMGYLVSLSYNQILKYSDVRNKHIREFIAGIELIKCFAWEYAVVSVITRIRRMEFIMILINAMLQMQSIPLSYICSVLFTMMICLSVYVATGGYLTSRLVFGFQTLLFFYQLMVMILSFALNSVGELRMTLKRIERMLQTSVMELTTGEPFNNDIPPVTLKAIELFGGLKDSHNCNEPNILISDVSFWLRRGESMSVIGRVGSGKTSLLLSLINEIDILRGECWLSGNSAFLPHQPWIISTSVRENITYGREWNENWYDEVITMCCLEIDIQQFPQGDLTIVGDRGITLSGGQKARVALARAVYADVDVYLLDDPLSSVDPVVAAKLLSIFTTGRFSDRTAVIVTHQLQFIDQTDTVLLLDDRKCVAYGSYSLIRNLSDFEQYREFINTVKDNIVEETSNDCDAMIAQLETPKVFQTDHLCVTDVEPSPNSPRERILHFNEISLKVYAMYFWNGGNILCNCSFLILALCSFFCLIIGKNYYLVWWIMASSTGNNTTDSIHSRNDTGNPLLFLSSNLQIILFIVFCILTSILLIPTFLLFAWIIIFASYRLHNSMLLHVLRAPMTFFYMTSSGSILNRFSKDIFAMENILPTFYNFFIYGTFIMLFTFIAAAITYWLTVIPTLILFVILILSRFQLVKIIRQLKRLESVAKSDVITHVSETIHGITTIRSLRLQSYQTNKLITFQNTHSRSWLVYFAYVRYFAFQTEIFIALYTFAISSLFVIFRHQLSPVVSAFALTQMFFMFNLVQFFIRVSAEVESNMVSVERVLDYINLPQEAPLHLNKPEGSFTIERGGIEFSNVEFRYSPQLPLVLKNISFTVQPGEKLGIIGRTGAGKSSLLNALLRLVELDSGRILIDGVDTKGLGLHELRSQISIIPQDPLLFSGTLRFTLDPFSTFLDEEIWESLGEVQLRNQVEQLKDQLLHVVSEGGSNFSVGERQLLCLARALLKQSKILMLDEATSFVDTITDRKIQNILHSKFRNCTLLTIAHRLHTLVNYDRIVVLDNGSIIQSTTADDFFGKSLQ